MKKNIVNFLILSFCLLLNFTAFAQESGPGETAAPAANGYELEGTGEGVNSTAPINDYIWVLAIIGLVFAFYKFKAIQNKRIHS